MILDRILVEARFSAPVQTGPGAHPASCTMGIGSFPGVKSGRGVTLTPYPLLAPWSRKSRAIPLLPLRAVRPIQSLSACTKVHFTLNFHAKLRQYRTDMKRVWANPLISFPEKNCIPTKTSFEFCVILCSLYEEYKMFCTLRIIILLKKNRICPSLSLYLLFLLDATERHWSKHLIIQYTAVIPVRTSQLN